MSNQDTRPAIWRSIAEKVDPRRRDRLAQQETGIQVGSLLPENSLVNRRTFLTVTGASAAAVGLNGCIRRPSENILPYTVQPEYAHPGVPLHFATSTTHRGEAVGLLVESHEGRPTKIEGNPQHPANRGRTDAQLQARILDLYDNERSGRVRQGETESTWAEFDAWWREKAGELGDGAGLRVLMPSSDSPSVDRARQAFSTRFPEAVIHTWSPISDENGRSGTSLAFGAPHAPWYQLGGSSAAGPRAKAILAIDCDFLAGERGFLNNARGFAEGRAVRSPDVQMNRLYVAESTLSVTGMNADHRLRISPSQADRFLRAVAAQLAGSDGVRIPPSTAAAVSGANEELPEGWQSWVEHCAADLAANRGRSLVCVGWRQPAHVHALAHALNVALGNVGTTVQYFPEPDRFERHGIGELVEAMSGLDTLLILGGNPVYDAPSDLGFTEALSGVGTTVHLASHLNETSAECGWHLPMAHELESWGDHRSMNGAISIQQPLIAPLRGGRASHELLAMVAGIRAWRGYNLVRNTMRERLGVGRFERRWRAALHSGIVQVPPARPRTPGLRDADVAAALTDNAAPAPNGWEVVFAPSYQTWDGSEGNNPWLQEMPDPVTKLVWGNAAQLSVASAMSLGLITEADLHREEYEGAFPSGWLLNVTTEAGTLSIPALVVPSHADEVLTLPLGFGRTKAGEHGNGVGVDVYPIRSSTTLGFASGVEVRPAGGREVIVQTQDHHSMTATVTWPVDFVVDRPLAIDATLEEYRETPNFAQFREPTPSLSPLWTQVDYSAPRDPAMGGVSYEPFPERRPPREGAPARYKWGMVLDLTTCTGCSACVIACQAENNIAFVGKMEVALGREMHWMRLDRYFVDAQHGGHESNLDDALVALQPVGCQHCEEAPCENVCPVAATTHSAEGLNDMAYNRCIGTRYCQNNCPYKVRRFNFLDWHGEVADMKRMVFNPNVTVRMRGVMEKCSYCVQRIQYARIQARLDTTVDGEEINERRIHSDEVQSACAQACPSGAITFGDLNDTSSEVHRMAHLDRQYSLLASIGTQPRTVYLGKIRNPNPEMV